MRRHPLFRATSSHCAALLAFAAWALRCTSAPSTQTPDAQPVDVSRDPPEVDPGCHYDCLGPRWMCMRGTIYRSRDAPIPCGYPVPNTFDMCALGSWRCEGADSCADDTPYAACIQRVSAQWGDLEHLTLVHRALCGSGSLKAPGALCTHHDDCRPSTLPDGQRLRCDLTSRRCVPAPRPAPRGYGASCAPLVGGPTAESYPTFEARDCGHCVNVHPSMCASGVCTMWCDFDDDCPEGSVCACQPGSRPQRLGVCVPGATRQLDELHASTRCDAGADASDVSDVSDAASTDAPADATTSSDAGAADVPPPRGCASQRACAVGRCHDPGPLGVLWNGAACVALSGCRCEGDDCVTLYASVARCLEDHAACPGQLDPPRCTQPNQCGDGEVCMDLRGSLRGRCVPVVSDCVGAP